MVDNIRYNNRSTPENMIQYVISNMLTNTSFSSYTASRLRNVLYHPSKSIPCNMSQMSDDDIRLLIGYGHTTLEYLGQLHIISNI